MSAASTTVITEEIANSDGISPSSQRVSADGFVNSSGNQQTSQHASTGVLPPSTANKIENPQVKPGRSHQARRKFNVAYKERILADYNACPDAAARGSLLRREGLYHSRICAWRDQKAAGRFKKNNCQHGKKEATKVDSLVRENEQLKNKLAQASAIIDLQKKVSELLGNHILLQE